MRKFAVEYAGDDPGYCNTEEEIARVMLPFHATFSSSGELGYGVSGFLASTVGFRGSTCRGTGLES